MENLLLGTNFNSTRKNDENRFVVVIAGDDEELVKRFFRYVKRHVFIEEIEDKNADFHEDLGCDKVLGGGKNRLLFYYANFVGKSTVFIIMMNGDILENYYVFGSLRGKYHNAALLWVSSAFNDGLKDKLNNYYHKFGKQTFCVIMQSRTGGRLTIEEVKRYKKRWVMNDKPNRNYLKVLDCPVGKVRFLFKNRIFDSISRVTKKIRKTSNDIIANELKNKHHFIIEAIGKPNSLTIGYLYVCKNYPKHDHICSFASVTNIKEMHLLCLQINKCSCMCLNKNHALLGITNWNYLNSLYKKPTKNPVVKNPDKQTNFISICIDNYKQLLENMHKIIIVFGEKRCKKNSFLASIAKHFGDKAFPLHNCLKKTDYLYYIKENISKIALVKIYYNYQDSSIQKYEDFIKKIREICDLCPDNVTIVYIQKSIACHERLNNAIKILGQKYEIICFIIEEQSFENGQFDNIFTLTENFRINKYLKHYEGIEENLRKAFDFLKNNRKNNEKILDKFFGTMLSLGDQGNNIENYLKVELLNEIMFNYK